MMEYKLDGKVHRLDKGYAYISMLIDDEKPISEIEKHKKEMIKEYVKYLMANNRTKCLEILISHFYPRESQEYSFIYRPAHMMGVLAQQGCISLKFKRSENDDLDVDGDNSDD